MQRESVILIPTLNERKNLENLIPAIFDFMPEISVLVVDDNSSDGTSQFINSIQARFPNLSFLNRNKNFGYGKACLAGFRLALERGYKYIVTMDADFSHDFRSVPNILNKLENNDVVIGSRYVAGGKVENWGLHRRILSKVANFYVRTILNLKIMDLTTGFNAYRREILSKIDLDNIKSDGYAFLVELKYKLSKSGAKIIEYPITFYERQEGKSKMSGKVILESIKMPWRLRF